MDHDGAKKIPLYRIKHRPRSPDHRNADGLSKRTNVFPWREKQLEKLSPVVERWNFLSQSEYDQLPNAPRFDVQECVIPIHPDLPAHLQQVEPVAPSVVRSNIRRT